MKSGFVAIVGKPNVGKSTLLNRLLGTKLVAVSNKPQTTRHNVLGILNEPDYQIIFTDTPGIFNPTNSIQKVMVKQALLSLKDNDITMLLVEPFTMETEMIKKMERATILVINKIDLLKDRKLLLPLINKYKEFKLVQEIVPISALNGDGIEGLKKVIATFLPDQEEPYYPTDILSDRDERFFVSELIQEKVFVFYGQEIPYATTVMIDEFKEREQGKYFIRATIYVERASEKAIIIGNKGEAIKRVGTEARKAIEKLINHPVYLELWVKVRKGWRRNLQDIKEFGYE
ncbi:MAG: GTPase Era [Candidatus Stahlbacteria bacterium]|nr:GTPase Era [Candidatus Stahlbacteria bacterium]